jgi:hypothetical protein
MQACESSKLIPSILPPEPYIERSVASPPMANLGNSTSKIIPLHPFQLIRNGRTQFSPIPNFAIGRRLHELKTPVELNSHVSVNIISKSWAHTHQIS